MSLRYGILCLLIVANATYAGESKLFGNMYVSIAYTGTNSLVMNFIPLEHMDCRVGQIYVDGLVKKEIRRIFRSQNPDILSIIDEDAFVKDTTVKFRYSCVKIVGLLPDKTYRFKLGDGVKGNYFIERVNQTTYKLGISDRKCVIRASSAMKMGKYFQCFQSNQNFKESKNL